LSTTGGNRVILPHLDPVPHLSEIANLIRRHPALDEEDARVMKVARVINGLLWAHAVVYKVREELGVTLGLHKPAHHAEDSPELVVLGSEGGDNGVQGPLARSESVRVVFYEAEGVGPVLKKDTGALRDNTAPEAPKEAVDKRAGVPFSVHRTQVGGVAFAGRRGRFHGPMERDTLPQLSCVLFGEEFVGRNVDELRVADLVVEVAKGELLGLGLEVNTLGA
jgi:hypothetical protein